MTTRILQIDTPSGSVDCRIIIPDAGKGPGLVVIAGSPSMCAELAEEGYVVLAPDMSKVTADDGMMTIAAQALKALPEQKGQIAAIGCGWGGVLACREAERSDLAAIVVYDFDGKPANAATVSCPLALHLTGQTATNAVAFRDALHEHDNARVYTYSDVASGFFDPSDPAYDRRIADIAHTRTLDLLRPLIGPHYDFVSLFAEHARHEFETRDVDATMATMVAEPYVNHVATMTGGVGHDMLKRFYKYHFVMQNSEERGNTPISYTVGGNRVVIEQVVHFRHDDVIDRMYPGIEPTGKMIELPLILCVKFRGPKVWHEHIYWDQASALAQIGLIDAEMLPVTGAEQAAKLLDETLPSNGLMADSWQTSEGKPI